MPGRMRATISGSRRVLNGVLVRRRASLIASVMRDLRATAAAMLEGYGGRSFLVALFFCVLHVMPSRISAQCT
ncbi:unnamed protein product [Toxocara canis]|uniref:Uncharacterized protein n=1 Tax=Toxocara canis TaxID=6265 RepID=A0A183UNQ9_TOXCA|nr:unnamed protein product [Toxocara canis]